MSKRARLRRLAAGHGLAAVLALSGCVVTETRPNPYYRGYDPATAEEHVWVGPPGADPDDPTAEGPPAEPPRSIREERAEQRDADMHAARAADAEPDPPTVRDEPGETKSTAKTVVIPKSVVDEMEGFLASPRLLIGEIVEVDLSRNPFLSRSAFSLDESSVERTDAADEARGVVTIVLINVSGVKTLMNTLPQVHFEGLKLVAIDRLVLRYWTRPRAERPIHLRAVARGKALFDDDGVLAKGGRIAVDAEVVDRGAGFLFDHGKQVDP